MSSMDFGLTATYLTSLVSTTQPSLRTGERRVLSLYRNTLRGIALQLPAYTHYYCSSANAFVLQQRTAFGRTHFPTSPFPIYLPSPCLLSIMPLSSSLLFLCTARRCLASAFCTHTRSLAALLSSCQADICFIFLHFGQVTLPQDLGFDLDLRF